MPNRSIRVPWRTVNPYPVIPDLTWARGRIGAPAVGAARPTDGQPPSTIARTASPPHPLRT